MVGFFVVVQTGGRMKLNAAGNFLPESAAISLETRLNPHLAAKRIPNYSFRRKSIIQITQAHYKSNMFSQPKTQRRLVGYPEVVKIIYPWLIISYSTKFPDFFGQRPGKGKISRNSVMVVRFRYRFVCLFVLKHIKRA